MVVCKIFLHIVKVHRDFIFKSFLIFVWLDNHYLIINSKIQHLRNCLPVGKDGVVLIISVQVGVCDIIK